MNRFIKTTAVIVVISVAILKSRVLSNNVAEYYNHCISVLATHTLGSPKVLGV